MSPSLIDAMTKAVREGSARIVVVFERRADGGLRVYSDDVPGFVLSHPDAAAVQADVVPALEGIISEMIGRPVSVKFATGQPATLRSDLERREYTTSIAA